MITKRRRYFEEVHCDICNTKLYNVTSNGNVMYDYYNSDDWDSNRRNCKIVCEPCWMKMMYKK